jgi:hypothetical protein
MKFPVAFISAVGNFSDEYESHPVEYDNHAVEFCFEASVTAVDRGQNSGIDYGPRSKRNCFKMVEEV